MRKMFWLSVLILVLGATSVSAQDGDADAPLLEMLARIPTRAGAEEWLTYIDYHAVVAARPGAPEVQSWDEADNILDGNDNELLMSALMSYQSGPSIVAQSLMLADETIEVTGVDLFAVERAVEFGEPPDWVMILDGDFDNEAITAAFAARDYTQDDAGELSLLCAANGCDTGREMNIETRDVANIFGGQLGRSQPLLLGDQWLASSASDVALEGVSDAVAGERETLADVPAYRLAAEALSAKGTVLQAYFITPQMIGGSLTEILLMNPRVTPEQLEAIIAAFETDFEPLPPYSLVVLAQVATEDEDLTVFALVYPDAETAEMAAEILPGRIETYTSLVTQATLSEMLDERGVTSVETLVKAGDERAVVLLTLAAPLPGTEVPDGELRPQTIGQVYSLFTRAYMQRDLGWLATVLD